MPVKLISPLYSTFPLTETDKKYGGEGEPTIIMVKQARQHEHAVRQDMLSKWKQIYDQSKEANPNELVMLNETSWETIYREEAWMTLVECNLINEEGKAMFPSTKGKDGHPHLTMTRDQFYEAWGLLFPDIAEEIIEKVHEMNPRWSRLGEAR